LAVHGRIESNDVSTEEKGGKEKRGEVRRE
jgi:hypothetical protein